MVPEQGNASPGKSGPGARPPAGGGNGRFSAPPGPRSEPLVDENPVVAKSIYVVGGIGVVGCLMLSFMMEHLLKVKTEASRSPVAQELEEIYGDRLVGSVDARVVEVGGERILLVRVKAAAGVQRDQLAAQLGGNVRMVLRQQPDPPSRVRIEVDAVDGSSPLVVELEPGRRPAATRPGAPVTRPPAAPSGGR